MPAFDQELVYLTQKLLPQLATAIFCGLLVGYGREKRNKPAGIRTNILIAVGCTLYSSIGFMIAEQYPNIDPTRIIGQVATGIGFLGAGAIWKENNKITGVTTAAFIWANSAIGVMIGSNFYLIPIIATLLIITSTWIFEFVENRVNRKANQNETKS